MTRAEIIARLRAGETGYRINKDIQMLLKGPRYCPAYTNSVDEALAAPIADGWRISAMTITPSGWSALAESGDEFDGEVEFGSAPKLAPAIMVAKLMTFEVGE